ncbi:MAG: hypothetical protein HY899_05875 [Deltaproteobacteria bacterium]|nr:hypothetical protein [Deltaproteobacteria bacterium]
MIREVERAARALGDGLRKRAGKASVPADLESVLHQLLQGLTGIASQIEKAVGELRRYLEANAAKTAGGGKPRKAAKKKATKKRKVAKKAPAAKKAARKKAAKPRG